jgi:zinc protease
MKTPRVWLSGLAVALMALATTASAQRARLDSIVRDTTLENGLQVIVVRNATIPFVTLQMVFKSGAFVQQVPEYAGLPHLIEHLLFRSDGGTFGKDADDIDAAWNGTTGTEKVDYFFTFPSKNLAKGIELMNKLVRKPDFSKSAIEMERKVVKGELERRASEPELLLRTEADLMLWGVEGFDSKNPGGNLFALGEATTNRLENLYTKFYVPNNAALIVAGDASDSAAFAIAARVFKTWKRAADPLKSLQPSQISPLKGIQKKIITAEVKDVTFLVRWHGPSVRKDASATYAADVFSGLVNQRISGSQKRLVDLGLLDELSFNYSTLNDVGPIELMARTSTERASAAADALGEELKKLAAPDYFTAEDLLLAKTRQRVSAHYRLERSASAAGTIADFWSTSGLSYFMNYHDGLEAQTAADVRKFVTDYIAGKPYAVIVRVSPSAWDKVGVRLQRSIGAWRLP